VPRRVVPVLLAILATAWVAIVVVTPVALAHGYVTLPAVVYEAAGLICHQRPERSFHLLGIQLPVCARCFGLYASGAIGAVAACMLADRGVERHGLSSLRSALSIAAIPTAVTLVCEWMGLWYPSGAARAIAALPLGVLAGWALVKSLGGPPPEPRHAGQVRYHS